MKIKTSVLTGILSIVIVGAGQSMMKEDTTLVLDNNQNNEIIDEMILTEHIDEIVKGNIEEKEDDLASTNKDVDVNGEKMQVEATAYTGDTITSTGTTPKWGTIAVDPTVIPYGTKVYIPQFKKTFIAEDCGSAIKGNKIDIFMNDSDTVYDWGRQSIEVYIVK